MRAVAPMHVEATRHWILVGTVCMCLQRPRQCRHLIPQDLSIESLCGHRSVHSCGTHTCHACGCSRSRPAWSTASRTSGSVSVAFNV